MDSIRTIDDLRSSTDPFIAPTVAGKFLRRNPAEIRLRCQHGENIGFRYEMHGTRKPVVKISRKSFINYLEELQIV